MTRTVPVTLDSIRNVRPADAEHLWQWVRHYTGVRLSRRKVCRAHQPPFAWFADQWFERPGSSLWLGSRGSGKSFGSAILTHIENRFHPRSGARILGGSQAQSMQVYEGLKSAVVEGSGLLGSDRAAIKKLLKTEATYANGSVVSILAASSKQTRGPHVPTVDLDEVDEIDPDIRESSLGIAMGRDGLAASVRMTSTWHRMAGPMSGLMEQAHDGKFPLYTTCVFDVLERCPTSRSGRFVGGPDAYENCPSCPIVKWCHSERDRNGNRPLAKLADGHYRIDDLIAKAQTLSERSFGSDFLCNGPKADGLWFPQFKESTHVTEAAEFRPGYRVHCSIDSGVFTGAVWFQVLDVRGRHVVHVFADYLSEGLPADHNAVGIRAIGFPYQSGYGPSRYSTDPAGGSRNPIGPTVIGEYERVGLKPLERWPLGLVADSLAIVENLLGAADGTVSLFVHPRCKALIAAFAGYRRAKRGGQWQDYPQDPQHPAEDMIDALRGGLKLEFPHGLGPKIPARTRSASHFLN
jgi:hypothetical protein